MNSCADCVVGNCHSLDKEFPSFCLTTHMDEKTMEEAVLAYEEPQNHKLAKTSAQVEYENYCKMTRVEETVEFCKQMGYKKIGIATCVGLLRETNIFAKVLRSHGLEPIGVACKAGSVKKTDLGLPKEYESTGQHICNPIFQAKYLNKEETDFNVVVGLCVGHDSLFNQYSKAPVTTLVVKDRVLAHNPVGALYQHQAYYKKIMNEADS